MRKILIPIVVVLFTIVLNGCKTVQYVPVESVHTDTLVINRLRTDSILVRDSITVDRRGDTVIVDRWRWRERYHTTHDTIYRSHADTIAVPYPVEAKQSKWQKATHTVGSIAIGAALCAIIILGLWLWKRRK